MRAGFSIWLGLGLAGLAAFEACLPEVTVDETLGAAGADTVVRPEMGGTGGGAGKGGPAGAATTSAGGASAAGSTSITEGVGGADGGITLSDPTAAGGAAGTGSSTPGDSGAGGTAAGTGGTSAAAGAGGLDGGGVATQCPLPTDKETACLAYCGLYTTTCADSPANDYKDLAGQDCLSTCYNSNWAVGASYTEKDSIICRCAHAYLALTEMAPTPHCYHSARVPTMGPAGCQPDP